MKREEEKQQAANNYGLNARLGYPRVMDETDKLICQAFKAGFDYSDEHPRKGLVDIERVEEWITGCFGFLNDAGHHNFKIEKFIENFRKAMLEEE